jgi:hypothetical protein
LTCRPAPRGGYLTIDALVALSITVLAVSAAVGLASNAVTRLAQSRDRLATVRIADNLYEGLYAGDRPDGQQAGTTDGRSWTYATSSAATPTVPSAARRARITVDRRFGPDLVVDAVLPPVPAATTAPATASLN